MSARARDVALRYGYRLIETQPYTVSAYGATDGANVLAGLWSLERPIQWPPNTELAAATAAAQGIITGGR